MNTTFPTWESKIKIIFFIHYFSSEYPIKPHLFTLDVNNRPKNSENFKFKIKLENKRWFRFFFTT